MEHIWSPWRYKYIASASSDRQCVFCRVQDQRDDRQNFVLHRASLNFVILNLFPYTSGHLMIVPYEHTGSLVSLDESVTTEMMSLAKTAQSALEAEYQSDGFNIGMNLGRQRGRRRGRSHPPACRSALGGRCQLRLRYWRNASSARRARDYVRQAEAPFRRSRLIRNRGQHEEPVRPNRCIAACIVLLFVAFAGAAGAQRQFRRIAPRLRLPFVIAHRGGAESRLKTRSRPFNAR